MSHFLPRAKIHYTYIKTVTIYSLSLFKHEKILEEVCGYKKITHRSKPNKFHQHSQLHIVWFMVRRRNFWHPWCLWCSLQLTLTYMRGSSWCWHNHFYSFESCFFLVFISVKSYVLWVIYMNTITNQNSIFTTIVKV